MTHSHDVSLIAFYRILHITHTQCRI